MKYGPDERDEAYDSDHYWTKKNTKKILDPGGICPFNLDEERVEDNLSRVADGVDHLLARLPEVCVLDHVLSVPDCPAQHLLDRYEIKGIILLLLLLM